MKKDRVNVKIVVPTDLRRAIESITKKRKISKSQFVQESLETYLATAISTVR